MKATELYTRFVIKSEENSTNDSISVSKDRFVQLINDSYIRFAEYIYEKKNEDDLRYIQELIIPDKKITSYVLKSGTQLFDLPKDYFEFENLRGRGTRGNCTGVNIDLLEIKGMNTNMILNDEFNSPSFKYREAPFNFAGNKIRIYIDDFRIDEILLSYYRYPKKLQLTDPSNPESQLDDSYELDFDEKAINRIINLALREFDMNNSNERFQVNQARTMAKP